MMSEHRRILFLFLDGVGLGEADAEKNPFASTPMPNLEGLLGGLQLVAGVQPAQGVMPVVESEPATLLAVDATMGVEGLPQSASGQAALVTGKNVPAWLGEHEGPKPTPPITQLLRQGSLFSHLCQDGRQVAFLNAYPPRYFASVDSGYRLQGVIALAARLAGLRLGTEQDLFDGKALSADFTGEGWRTHLGYPDTPVLSLAEAGRRLNDLSTHSDLSVFEYWLTDVAGHHQDAQAARSILESLDSVLGSLVQAWDGDQGLILLTSDHGNLEDMHTRHHTLNPVPLLLVGSKPLRQAFIDALERHRSCRSMLDLTDIAPAILRFLR